MASKPATTTKKAAAPAPKAAAKKPGKPVSAKSPARKTARPDVPKKATEIVTLKSVFERLAEGHEMSKKQAHTLAAAMVDMVTESLKKGARVRMSGLGVMEVKNRPARMGRNPATGEAVQIAASKKVAFRVAKELKEAV